MPQPSAEIVLLRVAICSFLEMQKRKDAEQFLRIMAVTLDSEESLSSVVPIRGTGSAQSVSRARRGAVALFRALLPVFLAHVRK